MKIKVHNWQGKANGLISALKKKGATIVKKGEADIFLIDFDGAVGYYTKKIEDAYKDGATVVLYSHGAPVISAWDGIWEPNRHSALYLAQSPGQKEVMESYGYPIPIIVIGWHYCKLKTFKPVKDIKKVLFAPWHPHGSGFLAPLRMQANTDTYEKLCSMPYELSVMYVGDIIRNGLKKDGRAEFIESDKSINFSLKQIDSADVVVSNLMTVASLAIARGKPVVVYGQHIFPCDGYAKEGLKFTAHWDNYKELMRYPYDISELKPKASQYLLQHAALHEATEWRDLFIGNPLDADKLFRVLEQILEKES